MSHLHAGSTCWAPSNPGVFSAYYRLHDPRDMHLGLWETPGDARLPGRVTVESAGEVGRYGVSALADAPSAEEAALSLKLNPTRLYGRSLSVRSDDVAIPGLLDASTTRQEPTAGYRQLDRPLESDLGTLSAVLMRGMAYQWQRGKPLTVVTAAYRVPLCNPYATVYSLVPKLNALDAWARDFARRHRVPLLLTEMVGDRVLKRVDTPRGHYMDHQGTRIARTASVACTDPVTAASFAMMARMQLSDG